MNKNVILSIIVFSQFACTSTWFASNAIINDLIYNFNLDPHSVFHLTSAVQLGFILGTLIFAFLAVSDIYSPSKVFFICALSSALFNFLPIVGSHNFMSLFSLRLLTGIGLAGIYPVGMKIAADYHQKGLGKALGYLVGALVLGTAFPHLIKGLSMQLPWKAVLIVTSGLAILGGSMILFFISNGPYRTAQTRFKPETLFQIFKNKNLRSAAFGYFGHMWELYTFWTFVPIILVYYNTKNSVELSITQTSFLVIGLGMISCILGGYISQKLGSAKVAFYSLLLSGFCCMAFPFIIHAPISIFTAYLIFWGLMVIADSPQFSSLVAMYATPETKGSALTLVNCIGFSITIVSIQLMGYLITWMDSPFIYWILVLGPALGLYTTYPLLKNQVTSNR